MSMKSLGTIRNGLGLYEVKIWQTSRIFRRPYLTVDCTLCDKPRGQRWWNGAAAWRYAQAHADWHQDLIRAAVNIPLPSHTTRSKTDG